MHRQPYKKLRNSTSTPSISCASHLLKSRRSWKSARINDRPLRQQQMQQGECCILLHISQKQRGDSSASYRHELERRSVPNSRLGPSWMLASPRGFRCRKGRRQRRPDWTTWRQWVLPEGVSCRTVGFVGHHCISPTARKQWKPGSSRLTSQHQIWLNCSVRLVFVSEIIKKKLFAFNDGGFKCVRSCSGITVLVGILQKRVLLFWLYPHLVYSVISPRIDLQLNVLHDGNISHSFFQEPISVHKL